MRWDRQNQFVIAGSVSISFTEILPGFQMLFVITGSSLKRGSLKRGSLKWGSTVYLCIVWVSNFKSSYDFLGNEASLQLLKLKSSLLTQLILRN